MNKNTLVLVALSALLAFSEASAGELSTLQPDDLVGAWVSSAAGGSLQLTFSADGSVAINQTFRGKTYSSELAPTKIEFEAGIIQINATDQNGIGARYTLGGWTSESSNSLFGTRFIFSEVEGKSVLINGIPIALEKLTKSSQPTRRSIVKPMHHQRISKSTFLRLKASVNELPDLQSFEEPGYTFYGSGYGERYCITKPTNLAHPAILGLLDDSNSDEIIFVARFSSDLKSVEQWITDVRSLLEKLKKQAKPE